ncbi:MAG: NAD(+) synthase [Candidatus Ancaeobacter aquaticus]|nr:NAD(+) synthase [Candidatus Ancaeobacter aquaticus]
MKLTNDLFKIDAAKTAEVASEFIKKEVKELGRDGIVVSMSGGLDSSVVASLCVKACGTDNVVGLMLPERQGNPEAEIYAKQAAAFLGIKAKKINISRNLRAIGTYRAAISYIPTKKLRDFVAKKFMSSSNDNFLLENLKGSKTKLMRNAAASIYSKQRIRAVVLYKFAEENNLLVVGAAHLTEDLVGLFVKFGIDDVADVMPIKKLFRTQVMQLAEYLELPKEIAGRKPNPDVIPGIDDKYFGMLGISADKIDLLLYGLLHDVSSDDIASQLDIEKRKVEEVKELIQLSDHMRNPSLAP